MDIVSTDWIAWIDRTVTDLSSCSTSLFRAGAICFASKFFERVWPQRRGLLEAVDFVAVASHVIAHRPLAPGCLLSSKCLLKSVVIIEGCGRWNETDAPKAFTQPSLRSPRGCPHRFSSVRRHSLAAGLRSVSSGAVVGQLKAEGL